MNTVGLFVALWLALSHVPQQPGNTLSLLCDGTKPGTITVDMIYQGEGETHLSWEFESMYALWDYDVRNSAALQRYYEWLQAKSDKPYAAPKLSPLEHRINSAVSQGRLGVVRPLNCLEATLLARQVRKTKPSRMREFVAFVLRNDVAERTKIYWLSGPDQFPPKPDRIHPFLTKDMQNGWRLFAIIHNHTGPVPAAAPSGSDVHYGLSWADAGAERFIVLGGTRVFDVSSEELRLFMRDEADGY